MLNAGNEIDALLQDDDFIRWVLAPDKQSHDYWNDWMQQDPVRKALLQEARKTVLSLYQREQALADGLVDKDLTHRAWEEISRQLNADADPKPSSISRSWIRYAVAAAVAVVALTVFFVSRKPVQKTVVANRVEQAKTDNEEAAEIQFTNSAALRRLINLPDGSRIVLSKNSSLHYHRLFNTGKREVFLTGDAFFDIAKDAKRPFYVYSGDVVTKVLGTSFRIVSDDQGKVTVSVRSGKVKVFRQNDSRRSQDQYLLQEHEQLIFQDKDARPVKASTREDILPAKEIPVRLNFSFDEASLQEILGSLEKTYHIHIVYDTVKNEKCRVTVTLDGESLYNKLDLLCMVIGATYHTDGYKIFVDSKGCN